MTHPQTNRLCFLYLSFSFQEDHTKSWALFKSFMEKKQDTDGKNKFTTVGTEAADPKKPEEEKEPTPEDKPKPKKGDKEGKKDDPKDSKKTKLFTA